MRGGDKCSTQRKWEKTNNKPNPYKVSMPRDCANAMQIVLSNFFCINIHLVIAFLSLPDFHHQQRKKLNSCQASEERGERIASEILDFLPCVLALMSIALVFHLQSFKEVKPRESHW